MKKPAKISYEQSIKLINEANTLVNENYRFGQALTNLLPTDLYLFYNATKKDFFYIKDYDEVVDLFYIYYAEEEKSLKTLGL